MNTDVELKFENIQFVYAYAVVPLLILFFVFMIRHRNKLVRKIGKWQVLTHIMPKISSGKSAVKFTLVTIAFMLIIAGIINPQMGSRSETTLTKGLELIVALDVSNSMMAEDASPNRLQAAKALISDLADEIKGNSIGIIVFAGESYVQLPPTSDIAVINTVLQNISPEVIPTQGTMINKAINAAISLFDREKKSDKIILVISDGEDHEGKALEKAREAVKYGIYVNSVSVGTKKGAPVPVTNEKGTRVFLKYRGQTVISKVNENMMKQLADAGKGLYFKEEDASAGIKELANQVNALKKEEVKETIYSNFEDRFYYFIGAALALLFLELIIAETHRRRLAQ